MRTLRPLAPLSDTSTSICLWLNGSESSLRPIWTRLWNQAAVRFATDGAANVIVPRDDLLRPDVVCGDFDSIHRDILDRLENTKTKVVETPDQDKTDLTKALELVAEYACKTGIERIVILGGLSGRFDHSLATLNSLLNAHSIVAKPVFVFDGENNLCVLPEGTSDVHVDRKWLTGKCGIVPFCQRKTVVTIDGFRWNLENAEMAFGGLISTSNEVASDRLTVTTSAPLILTFELTPEAVSA